MLVAESEPEPGHTGNDESGDLRELPVSSGVCGQWNEHRFSYFYTVRPTGIVIS